MSRMNTLPERTFTSDPGAGFGGNHHKRPHFREGKIDWTPIDADKPGPPAEIATGKTPPIATGESPSSVDETPPPSAGKSPSSVAETPPLAAFAIVPRDDDNGAHNDGDKDCFCVLVSDVTKQSVMFANQLTAQTDIFAQELDSNQQRTDDELDLINQRTTAAMMGHDDRVGKMQQKFANYVVTNDGSIGSVGSDRFCVLVNDVTKQSEMFTNQLTAQAVIFAQELENSHNRTNDKLESINQRSVAAMMAHDDRVGKMQQRFANYLTKAQ